MDLPSFLWLWKMAAWSMGLSVTAYFLLAVSGGWLFYGRSNKKKRPRWLRSLHITIGSILVGLVLLLLGIGLVGTLGHYGSLGHSSHLMAGIIVVALVLASAASASRIHPQRPWARQLHVSINLVLLFGFMWVSWTGWSVVQKYLP